ncbi:MAG: hypothetical protein P4N60_13705 [Verrucomicrobiae bacterium]|nr:hypothetical protein [Verrucomicrobiae bacterium]
MAAENDNALQLLIEFKAQLSEAVKAREELVEMKRQATAMGVSTAGLDDEIKKADASLAALGKKSLPEAHEGMEIFNTHGREMHRLIHEMDHILPGLGLTLRSVFHPQAMGIAGMVLIVEQLVEYFKKAHEQAEELKKTLESMPELSGLLGQTAGLRDSMEDADIATEKFFDGLRRSHDQAESINTALTTTITLLKAQNAAEEEIAKKQKERDLARLEFLHNSGQLNDAQYIAAKAATEQDFSQDATKRKLTLDQTILDQTQGAETLALSKKDMASRDLPAAEQAAAAAKLRIKTAEENVKRAEENAANANSAISGMSIKDGKPVKNDQPGLQEQFDALTPEQKRIGNKYSTVEGYERGEGLAAGAAPSIAVEAIELHNKLLELRGIEDREAKKAEAAKAELEAAKRAALAPEAQLDSLTKQITQLQTEADALHKQVQEKKAQLALDKSTAATEKPIDQQTAGYKEADDLAKTDSGKALLAGEAAARRIRAGTQTADDAQNLIALASKMAGHTVNLKTAVEMMEAAANGTSAFVNLATRLAKAVEGLKPGDLADLETRVQQLEFQNSTRH